MTLAAFTMWAVTAFTAPTMCQTSEACIMVDALEHDLPATDADDLATLDLKSSAPIEGKDSGQTNCEEY